jgi:hypothetical protein
MKLSETLSRLLLEYTDRPLPINILLKHAGNNGFGMIAGMLTTPMLIPIPLAGFSALVGRWCKITGIFLAWDAFLLSLPLPIPFTNLIPAYTILFLVIGLLESDGLFVLIGYGLTAATTAFFGSIAGIIWQLATQWLKI